MQNNYLHLSIPLLCQTSTPVSLTDERLPQFYSGKLSVLHQYRSTKVGLYARVGKS